MIVPTDEDIEEAILAAEPADGHPILDWSDQNLVEDVALGGIRSIGRLTKRRQGRGMSPDDLQKSKSAAEMVGTMGEQLVNAYLARLVEAGELSSFEWTSNLNAIAPYDFKIVAKDGTLHVLDAKSTSGGFLNPIHLSLGEIWTATEGPEPYDIYRVFKVTETTATLRIAPNIGPVLRPVVKTLMALPHGVAVDSLSVDPNILPFETAEIDLSLPEEDTAEN
jgi:hypothetical protein